MEKERVLHMKTAEFLLAAVVLSHGLCAVDVPLNGSGAGVAVVPASGCPDFTVERPRATGGPVVKASDFGFSTENDKNATAINRALAHCRKVNACRLELAPGTYRCFDEPGVVVRDFTDFTFDGKGAVLVLRRAAEFRSQPQSELKLDSGNMLVQRCVRIQVGNFTMDWDWEHDPLAGFVVCTDKHIDEADDASWFDLTFTDWERHPLYPNPVPVQKMMTMDPSHERFRRGGGFSFGQTEGHFGTRNEWVKPNVLRVWPRVRPVGRNLNPLASAFSPSGNRAAVRRIEKGGTYRLQHCYYGKNGLNLDGNRHLTVKDVNVWCCFGMAMVVDGPQRFWEVENFRVVPPSEAEFAAAYPGRKFFRYPVTSTSDGHHVARSQGDARYINCRWSLNNDDSSNFHDRFTIAIRVSERTLQVINRRGTDYFRAQPGTTLELREPNFAPTGFKAKLVKVVGGQLVVDRPLPEQKGICFLVWDRSFGTDRVMMKNCVFEDQGWRNIFSPSDLTIENCVFRRTSGVPVRFIADYRSDLWCEGMGATNLVVRNCLFDNTCVYSDGQPEISTTCVTPGGWDVKGIDPGFVGGNMLVENCRFVNSGGPVLDLQTGKNVIFRNNVIELGARISRAPATAGILRADPSVPLDTVQTCGNVLTPPSCFSGKISDSAAYERLHPRFAKAFVFLRRPDLAALPPGRHEIDGDDIWAMVQDVDVKPFGDVQRAEVHGSFIDIQSPIVGTETIGAKTLTQTERNAIDFNEAKDVGFLSVETEPYDLKPGEFAVFMPPFGAHAPCRTREAPHRIRKLVIKVRK